jgi:hypothetical protein
MDRHCFDQVLCEQQQTHLQSCTLKNNSSAKKRQTEWTVGYTPHMQETCPQARLFTSATTMLQLVYIHVYIPTVYIYIYMMSVLPGSRSAVLSVTPELQHLGPGCEMSKGGFPLPSPAGNEYQGRTRRSVIHMLSEHNWSQVSGLRTLARSCSRNVLPFLYCSAAEYKK